MTSYIASQVSRSLTQIDTENKCDALGICSHYFEKSVQSTLKAGKYLISHSRVNDSIYNQQRLRESQDFKQTSEGY